MDELFCLTCVFSFEVIGTFWVTGVTLYAMVTGSFPYDGRFKALHTRMATHWTAAMSWMGHWAIGKRMFIRLPEGGFRSGVPLVVAMRHVSTNDVVIGPHLFGWTLGYNLRMVMKKDLLWDPLIEAAGTRCDNFYINRFNHDNMDIEVEGVAQLLRGGPLDADGRVKGAVIYPEGTRHTPSKKKSVLESMERSNSPHLEFAKSLKATLPPRLKGLLALWNGCPQADLVLVGHVGYDEAMDMLAVIRGDVFNTPLSIRMWRLRADEMPKDEEGRVKAIFEKWKELDTWCHEEREAQRKNPTEYLKKMIEAENSSQYLRV